MGTSFVGLVDDLILLRYLKVEEFRDKERNSYDYIKSNIQYCYFMSKASLVSSLTQ